MKIRKRLIFHGILILILIFLVIIASKNRQLLGLIMMPTQYYEPTRIPADTTDLFEYEGYIENNIVYIYVQGGPNWEFFDRNLAPFTWMPHSGTYIKVFPYQAQMINHSVLTSKIPLNEEQALHEVMVSAEILYRTIAFFKTRNKKVYIFCISHGSQIGLEMLRNHPNIFDGLALTMIRLNYEKEAVALIRNGKAPYYNPDNELTSRYLLPSFLRFTRLNNRVENMTMLMKVCKNNYTELLKHKELSNLIYVYGKYDHKVGCPRENEIEFLKNKGVSILELECGHEDLGNREYLDRINHLLVND